MAPGWASPVVVGWANSFIVCPRGQSVTNRYRVGANNVPTWLRRSSTATACWEALPQQRRFKTSHRLLSFLLISKGSMSGRRLIVRATYPGKLRSHRADITT